MANGEKRKPENDDMEAFGAAGSISGQGRSGGNLARDLSTRDELKRAFERPAGVTRVTGKYHDKDRESRVRSAGANAGSGDSNRYDAETGAASSLAYGTWILIADSEKALFFENAGDAEYPVFEVVRKEEQENPPAREQAANRRGRFNDGPSPQRSAVDDTDWHQLAKERFAHDLADILYRMAHRHDFDSIILVAAPGVLGELRKTLHKEVEQRVVGEVAKNLTNHPVHEIEKLIQSELAHKT